LLGLQQSLPGKGVTALFGPSGCGKTSILRVLAGLEPAATAHISVGGQVWQNDTAFLPAHKRAIGYVFQESSLFPHLTVAQNIQYGRKRAGEAVQSAPLAELIDLLDISALLPRKPDGLSGGEQQRVAIVRALAS